jgi:hypothetical protein
MTDTLQTLVSTVGQNSDNAIDIINKVDSFYNSAWDKLVIVGSVSFAVIGILVPFVIQWYQKKTLKISEELLKKDIENQSLKLKTELLADIKIILDERIKDFEKKIEELNASATAKTFHLQGNSQLGDKDIGGALADFVTAAQNYLICGDYSNLQTVLRIILENCVPKLSQEEINDLRITHNCDLDLLLNDLTLKDDNGVFSQVIRNIQFKVSKLPKTTIEKPKSTD